MKNGSLSQKLFCTMLAAMFLFVAGCGGHMANPVDRYMLGDEDKSCNALYAEMASLDNQILEKKHGVTNRDITNVLCFVGGFFIIVPFFFIDAKGSHEVELEALVARKDALQIIWHDKGCTVPTEVIK